MAMDMAMDMAMAMAMDMDIMKKNTKKLPSSIASCLKRESFSNLGNKLGLSNHYIGPWINR